MLEVGCGGGELARVLDGAGYDVLAIDPQAPEGPIFRRVALEQLDEPGPFEAVVARWSLHHVGDLSAALDRIAALSSLLVLDEFGWDLLDEQTAEWYEGQRRVLRAAGREPAELGWPDAWADEHRGLHTYETMRTELDRRFEQRHFEWTPYLHGLLGGPTSEELEQALIGAGGIRALGFRYVGVRSV